ncbi:MAG: SpoIID/LytB domain-containing protein [Fimbriimonadales bacterium]|nr:SpoIID/LytB domain-containing protein [Fimbriimonadales bacterium]
MQRVLRALSVGLLLYSGLADAPRPRDSDWLIRVGLEQAAWAQTLYVSVSEGALRWIDPRTAQILGEGAAGQIWELRRTSGRYAARSGRAQIVAERLAAEPVGAGFVMVGVAPNALRRYRGHLEWIEREGKLLTLNWVLLDDYLKATLPREMPPNFHTEALKAQAVATRTFTLRRLNRYRQWGYDLCDHAPCQVYGGVDAEHPRTSAAVDATAGETLTYEGRLIEAVYTGSCGGHTAPVETAMVNTRPLPYLAGAPDVDTTGKPFCSVAPNAQWELTLTRAELARRFPQVGRVRALEVAQRTGGGHAQQIRLRGERATLTLSGAAFRSAMGAGRVRSLMFEVQPHQEGWKLTGRGAGHGAGLCQWGAQGRALAGQTYRQILQAYYPGAEVQFWSAASAQRAAASPDSSAPSM